MSQFVNDVNSCVTEALEGIAHGSLGNLVLLRDRNVILLNPEKHQNRSKVAIVCGGGSGHEPAHSSFVKNEMLSAAICGDVFASPSVGAIVDGIRTLVGNGGCRSKAVLLIIKNYTGDKINFGMASEILLSEGILLRKLIIADDVSLPEIKDRRGVAGTVLVYKIAGAYAFQQQNSNSDILQQLNEVYEIADKVNKNIHSMGCALSSCHRPDGSAILTLPEGEMEIGVGIHGERGVLRTPVQSSDEIVTILIDKILTAKQQDESADSSIKRMILLTNNLGSVSGLEMGVVHRKAISYLHEKGYEVSRAYCGTYMTCLDMRGISLTLLTIVDDRFLDLLDVGGSDFSRTNWKPDSDYSPSSSSIYIEASISSDSDFDAGSSINATVNQEFMSIIEKVCRAGVDARGELNNLDRECGDGDAGNTLATACNAILDDLHYFGLNDINLAFRRIARCLTNAVGGTSGPLYAVFFIRAAAAFSEQADRISERDWKTTSNWIDAVEKAISGIEELGDCSRGDKTILDGLYTLLDSLKGQSPESNVSMECLVQATKDGAENTRKMEARAGRARYVEGKGVGSLDPGAYAVYLLMKALL
ncbi:MAG: dihydroxyacetone kinase subunit DhaK [Candidatus Scalindua sp.]|jgi:dihydroxyacetone kinase|nr:dihydroxyacetone kinase subunit DhaK [Candidatus Scalindua sp.]MDV5166111.1 dihydroxyacetone kinase subunit DhaK [Candidatus Scalindua sp.]